MGRAPLPRHHGGYVRLRSDSPFRRPGINFCSFPDGDNDADLKGLVDGVNFVQGFLAAGKASGTVRTTNCRTARVRQ